MEEYTYKLVKYRYIRTEETLNYLISYTYSWHVGGSKQKKGHNSIVRALDVRPPCTKLPTYLDIHMREY